ncbi:MAG: ribosomal-processing cysteine protease Prp [Treponema sp.]|nr:ribosomal-processing cysteine protease Prp [Treponema sp.]
MIRIDAVFDRAGFLRSCRISGHAGAGKKGYDIVCAAVSVLSRTMVRTLEKRKGIAVESAAPGRGLLSMDIRYEAEGQDFLSVAGAFFMEGLSSICEEYPAYCTMNIRVEEKE